MSSSVLVRAPGRVNLIGEHTDYNDGFVMPAAIDRFTSVEITPLPGRRLYAFSEHFQESAEIDLEFPEVPKTSAWSNFVFGVAITLEASGIRLQGARLRIRSEVPIAAGLSSSAALEVAVARALLERSGVAMEPLDVARICQRAEHEFAGTRCGIMDQFAACFGVAGNALLLDCRSLSFQPVSLPERVSMVIANSMVRRELASSVYNDRRAECEHGVSLASRRFPGKSSLRDVAAPELEACRDDLPEVIYRRCRHVVSENERVIEAAAALRKRDVVRFGELMYESHRSLREDFEVSCDELDLLVDLARRAPGVYGSRMTGGGLGGCTISLVDTERVEEFCMIVREGYTKAGHSFEVYVCNAADGCFA
jgi:galactokinase